MVLTTYPDSSSITGSAPKAPAKVLLVDNKPDVRQSVKTSLEAAGYVVMFAADGYQALASVVSLRPDIILIDTMTPRLDGYQVCALIKSNSDYLRIPVIMLSGMDGQFDQQRARLVGMDAHVSKPITAAALAKALDGVQADGKISVSSP